MSTALPAEVEEKLKLYRALQTGLGLVLRRFTDTDIDEFLFSCTIFRL